MRTIAVVIGVICAGCGGGGGSPSDAGGDTAPGLGGGGSGGMDGGASGQGGMGGGSGLPSDGSAGGTQEGGGSSSCSGFYNSTGTIAGTIAVSGVGNATYNLACMLADGGSGGGSVAVTDANTAVTFQISIHGNCTTGTYTFQQGMTGFFTGPSSDCQLVLSSLYGADVGSLPHQAYQLDPSNVSAATIQLTALPPGAGTGTWNRGDPLAVTFDVTLPLYPNPLSQDTSPAGTMIVSGAVSTTVTNTF